MKTKKIWRWLIVIVVVLLILAIIGPKIGLMKRGETFEVTTAKAEKRTIIETITASGNVQPEIEVKISSDVSGEIVELPIKEGDEVKRGDLLVKVKPDVYLSSFKQMEATLEASRANLGNTKARLEQIEAQFAQTELTFQRNKKLFEQGVLSQADYDNSLSAYNMGKADVEAARQSVVSAEFSVKSTEASLEEAKANLTKTIILAPNDGTISKLNVKLGERVVGTMQMAGTELLRIADLKRMEVVVSVNENDIVRVHFGDTALIDIDAYPDNTFRGVVTSIAHSSTSSSTSGVVSADQVANYEVHIHILPESYQILIPKDNPYFYPFRPGMSATADIHTRTERNIIAVPVQAVTTRSDSIFSNKDTLKNITTIGNKKLIECVFKYKPNKTVKLVPVKTGIQDDSWIQIISGINAGDEIVTGPFNILTKKLKNNDPVAKKENAFEFYKK